jgi:hypothetical protein
MRMKPESRPPSSSPTLFPASQREVMQAESGPSFALEPLHAAHRSAHAAAVTEGGQPQNSLTSPRPFYLASSDPTSPNHVVYQAAAAALPQTASGRAVTIAGRTCSRAQSNELPAQLHLGGMALPARMAGRSFVLPRGAHLQLVHDTTRTSLHGAGGMGMTVITDGGFGAERGSAMNRLAGTPDGMSDSDAGLPAGADMQSGGGHNAHGSHSALRRNRTCANLNASAHSTAAGTPHGMSVAGSPAAPRNKYVCVCV